MSDRYSVIPGMIAANTAQIEKNNIRSANAARERNAAAANEAVSSSSIQKLKNENKELKEENTEQAKVIQRQKELLKDWMVSQIAFKNLFKKYGKLPDGRLVDDIPKAEVGALIDPFLEDAKRKVENGL